MTAIGRIFETEGCHHDRTKKGTELESTTLQPFYQHIKLTDYFPLPRGVLELNLPSTALLVYSVLLDRATLS